MESIREVSKMSWEIFGHPPHEKCMYSRPNHILPHRISFPHNVYTPQSVRWVKYVDFLRIVNINGCLYIYIYILKCTNDFLSYIFSKTDWKNLSYLSNKNVLKSFHRYLITILHDIYPRCDLQSIDIFIELVHVCRIWVYMIQSTLVHNDQHVYVYINKM